MINGNLALQPQIIPTMINDNSINPLESKGWVKYTMGTYRSNGQIKNKEGFTLYIRRRNLNHFIDAYSKKSSSDCHSKPHKTWASNTGSSLPMGNPEPKLTPCAFNGGDYLSSSDKGKDSLPALSSFSEYPSLMAIRKDMPCLLIGYDSEWETLASGRDMLSWQYALIDGKDLVEFVFLKDGEQDLSLMDALGCILDHLGKYHSVDIRTIRRYKYCSEWKNDKPVEVITDDVHVARRKCNYVFRSDIGFTRELIQEMPDRFVKRGERDWAWFHTYLDFSLVESIKICIVCHAGKVDLSALSYGKKNLLRYLTDVQGGLVSLQPVRYAPRSLKNVNNTYVYPISLSIADTMCHAPVGKKKLKDLGEVLGVKKVDIDTAQKEHMKGLLDENPVLYMEYASTDSVVTVLYASALYGYNAALPVTITSATAGVMKETMMKYLECRSTEEFNYVYRGLEKVNHGKYKIQDRPGFVEATNLEPISNDANNIQYFASQGYHGGYNICTEVGYFPFETFDYDLKNAYPTAMCLVPDINWENPIRSEIIRRDLSLADFTGVGGINPITPFVGYVRFEFPETVKYPCIPICVDGIPQYPLTSEGMDGVYVAGPFVWLALKLGAHVYCDRGYFLNIRYVKDFSQESRSLAAAVKQLVVDRDLAKSSKGKGSLEELILKTLVNGGYGKNAQNIIQKAAWSALKDLMEDLGCSAITNPFSGMMITSIVQVELIAAQNQIHNLGYMSCSVTTDGFISNCPEDILKSLDLYGLRRFMEASRIFLTDGDPELWETKHHQDDLVNFTTRGNVSLRCKDRDGYDGVCAHNSSKSGFASDSYEDRLWLMTQVLGRTGTVDYTDDEWTSFKDLVQGKPFVVKTETRHIRMDFDMKRKPIRSSFTTDRVVIEGTEYEIAHFDTDPFRNIEEFRLYRNKKNLTDVLRTESDWDLFWLKLDLNATGAQPRNMEWAILNSCIMGYRAGRWDIPGLNDKTVVEKCEWINAHNTSGHKFKPSDWKNARRPERQANMLPLEMIKTTLDELINADI
ncbi:hypothetical protein DXB59_07650 [Ruminococcus sp. OM05-10BH]|nr:hypothetical protein DXB59_07650 [Ruminococcus sp. OM05-10BH]